MADNVQKQYFNDAQLYPLLLSPRDFVGEMGRGTGKGLIDATRMVQVFQHMPGCCMGFVSPSYKKCLTNTLPSMLVHLEDGAINVTSIILSEKSPGRPCTGKSLSLRLRTGRTSSVSITDLYAKSSARTVRALQMVCLSTICSSTRQNSLITRSCAARLSRRTVVMRCFLPNAICTMA